jgi:hypothetical protein
MQASRQRPRARWRSRLRQRPRGMLARAWARAESLPSAPTPAVGARAFPACPTACSPSRLSLLSGAARSVSLAGYATFVCEAP